MMQILRLSLQILRAGDKAGEFLVRRGRNGNNVLTLTTEDHNVRDQEASNVLKSIHNNAYCIMPELEKCFVLFFCNSVLSSLLVAS